MFKDIMLTILIVIIFSLLIYMLYKHKKDLLFKMALNYCQEAEDFFKSKEGKEKLNYVVTKIRSHLPWWLDPLISENILNRIIEDALSYLQQCFGSSKEKQIAVVNEILKKTTDTINDKNTNLILSSSAKSTIETINKNGYVEAYADVHTDLHGDNNIKAGIKAGFLV